MNPLDAWKALTMTGRLAACLVAIIVLALVWMMVTEPGRARHRAAEAGITSALGAARVQSAGDAGQILDQAHQTAAQSEQTTRENADAIHAAPGADQRLDPALNRTGRNGLCKYASYRDRPECVQQPGRTKPAG